MNQKQHQAVVDQRILKWVSSFFQPQFNLIKRKNTLRDLALHHLAPRPQSGPIFLGNSGSFFKLAPLLRIPVVGS